MTRLRLGILIAACAVWALVAWLGMVACDTLGVPCDEDER